MRQTLLGICRNAAAALCVVAAATPAAALEPGEQVPELSLPGNGQTVQFAAQPGKVIYLDFWASWCGTCRQSFPWMNAMQQKYGDRDFAVIGVNLDAESADAAKFLERVPAQFTIAYDQKGESARRFGVKGMPTSMLIGRDGKVIARHSGFSEAGSAQLEEQIRGALEARP